MTKENDDTGDNSLPQSVRNKLLGMGSYDINRQGLLTLTEGLQNFKEPQEIFTVLVELYQWVGPLTEFEKLSPEIASLLMANIQLAFLDYDQDYHYSSVAPLSKIDPVLFLLIHALHALQEGNYYAHSELVDMARHLPDLLLETVTAILERDTTGVEGALRVLYTIDKGRAVEYALKSKSTDEHTQAIIEGIKQGYKATYNRPPDYLNIAQKKLAKDLFGIAVQVLYPKDGEHNFAAFDKVLKLPQIYSLPILAILLTVSNGPWGVSFVVAALNGLAGQELTYNLKG